MEHFQLSLPASTAADIKRTIICGVVSSGNLEVLVTKDNDSKCCMVDVNTSAVGFQQIWQAVLNDFANRHPLGGMRISINDAGATPAVVSLRLDQAFESCVSEQ